MFDPQKSLQDQFAPQNACFGCGPANVKGLRIQTFIKDNLAIASWKADLHHEAFPGILNGGIIGALLDCHSNWAAAYYLMKHKALDKPPCTVTAYYNVALKRPTPSDKLLNLVARLEKISEERITISAQLQYEDIICATCIGEFVAVKEGHPAFHRW